MINVLSTHAGADTAGIGYALSRTFDRHPDITVRSAVRSSNYIEYPHDLDWSQAWKRAQGADVLHVHNTLRTAHVLHAWNKPTLIHHHGTHYRDNHVQLNREVSKKAARAVVSTLDMLEYSHDLTWVPHPYELDQLPKPAPVGGDKILIGHAPTDRAVKSTDAFLAACEKFAGVVVPVVIEHATWSTCLRAKAAVDVYYDQVALGYGCNAIEAWGMGIPVIAGAPTGTLERMRDTFGVLPFVEATETTIADAIEQLLDEEAFATYSCLGQQHVRRWHDGRETRARLEPIYRELADR